jgi:NADH:ubiquinone oxidoreductase subunit 3 (subunit A)
VKFISMLPTSILSTPVTVFIISLAISSVIYFIGGKIAPKSQGVKEKYKPYACGQDLPAEKFSVLIGLFNYATVFMVFDVVAFILILSMGFPFVSPVREIFLLYCAILFASLAIFLGGRD